MSFIKIEIDHSGNGNEYEKTITRGFNIERIGSIRRYGDSSKLININNGESKSFKTTKECSEYFEYIASKLEAIDLSPPTHIRK